MTLDQYLARPASYAAPESDEPARQRILTDLDTNMLVEAGAGSGKTTLLVGRMVALVARGTPVEEIAAVTFTRKAANELRERFQLWLEARVREEPPGGELAQRCDAALRALDRAFLGTIHSFCARLLRERPLEVPLDPSFEEVTEDGWEELKREFWRRWIERAKRAEDPTLEALRRVGIDAAMLYDGFELVMAYPDVDFSTSGVALPDITACCREMEALLARARALLPHEEPADGWDGLMKLVRRLDWHRRFHPWTDTANFCAAIEAITESQCKLTQKRWSDSREGKAAAKQLSDDFLALLGGRIADVLRRWREYRYPIVMRFLQQAAEAFVRERRATGQLGFEDLLLLTAALLREQPAVRNELGNRYRHLLVDEFQDTDPIQAEICFLLTSDAAQGNDWQTVMPRAGALFVVGDPKQSIYRFRRADIQTYELVKQRLAECGAALALTRNFRSVEPIARFVNEYFERTFPAHATEVQAAFRPMHTVQPPHARDGVYRYSVRPAANNKPAILEADAEMVASWIAERIASGERTAGDFLILTATRAPIEMYARALAERNVAVATTGAPLPQEHELAELLIVLRAIADPENRVRVAAALEGLFFGLSPADLFDAQQARVRFSITHPPKDDLLPAGRALRQLHEWWKISQRHPADVLLERILDDTGLLFHAASQPLGDARAGALLHLVEALRTISIVGASAITNAMERIELLLEAEAPDAPLRPGRTDAVRVMNLHKAKGLEAEVVILAAPCNATSHDPAVHVRRGAGERAVGGLCITQESGTGARVLAQPPDWQTMVREESAFQAAERMRLLYVATTRAKRELVVAQCVRSNAKGAIPDQSAWSPLAPTLDALATQIDLPVTAAPGRRRVTRELASLELAIAEAESRRRAAAAPLLHVTTVTASAKAERDERRAYDLPEAAGAAGNGTAWGRAVHRVLEGMGRGRRDAELRSFIAAVARDEALDSEQGRALETLANDVAGSDAWARLLAHGAPRFELSVMQCVSDGGVERITEGVIDAAALGAQGWHIVDWKTDAVGGDVWRERLEQYTRQVDTYVSILREVTGQRAEGRVEHVPRAEEGVS